MTTTTKMSVDAAELKIVEQPNAMWYKDVGGKKSHLTARLELRGRTTTKYRLKASLYYESGKRLADEWQWILHFLDTIDGHLTTMSATQRQAEVHFRIEKVSTSFMNQKFKVRFHLEPEGGSTSSLSKREWEKLERNSAVFTSPIESKAKPKRTGARKRFPGGSTRASKRRRRNSFSEDGNTSTLEATLEKFAADMEEMKERQIRQDGMLRSALERLDRALEKLNELEDQSMLKRPTVERLKSDYTLSKFGLDVSPPRDSSDLATLDELHRLSPRKELMSPRHDAIPPTRRFASDNSLFGIGVDDEERLERKERPSRFLAMLS